MALLPVVTATGQRIALGDVASIFIEDGPPSIKSENSRINGWTFIDIEGVDVGNYVEQAMEVVDRELALPAGQTKTHLRGTPDAGDYCAAVIYEFSPFRRSRDIDHQPALCPGGQCLADVRVGVQFLHCRRCGFYRPRWCRC